jgi:hypothetical protein
MGAGKIPLEKMNTRAIPEGLQYGLQFMTRDDPNVFEPLKLFKPLRAGPGGAAGAVTSSRATLRQSFV